MEIRSCLYCGGKAFTSYLEGIEDRLGHVKGEWSFHQCQSCQSVRLTPFPNESDIPSYYPEVYSVRPELKSVSLLAEYFARLRYRLFFRPQYRHTAKQVLKAINYLDEGLQILDIGCGSGLRLLEYRNLGHKVQGIDLQPEAVEYANKHYGIKVFCSNAEAMTEHFRPESLDLITAAHILEHVTSVRDILKKARLLLKPGGWFVATVPLIDSNQARLFGKGWVGVTEAPRHLTVPSMKGVKRCFETEEFQSIKIKPSALFDCLGAAILSSFPGTAITHLTHRHPFSIFGQSVLGLLAGIFFFPFIIVDNYVARRPAVGIIYAQKPEA